jgi:chemotaxis protein histidine kinase CheA
MADPFRALRQEYLEGARRRMDELRQLVEAALTDPSAVARIRMLAHNLRGSGGFYGFTAISEAAAELEELALSILEGRPAAVGALPAAARRLVQAVETATMPSS